MTRPDESSGQQTNKTWLGASAHPRIRASASITDQFADQLAVNGAPGPRKHVNIIGIADYRVPPDGVAGR